MYYQYPNENNRMIYPPPDDARDKSGEPLSPQDREAIEDADCVSSVSCECADGYCQCRARLCFRNRSRTIGAM